MKEVPGLQKNLKTTTTTIGKLKLFKIIETMPIDYYFFKKLLNAHWGLDVARQKQQYCWAFQVSVSLKRKVWGGGQGGLEGQKVPSLPFCSLGHALQQPLKTHYLHNRPWWQQSWRNGAPAWWPVYNYARLFLGRGCQGMKGAWSDKSRLAGGC